MIHAMWDITHSCFVCLPEPQRIHVMSCAIQCHSGFILCLDHELLTSILYGDDVSQARNDELLSCLANTAVSEFAHLAPPLSSELLFRCDALPICFWSFQCQFTRTGFVRQRRRVRGIGWHGWKIPCMPLCELWQLLTLNHKSHWRALLNFGCVNKFFGPKQFTMLSLNFVHTKNHPETTELWWDTWLTEQHSGAASDERNDHGAHCTRCRSLPPSPACWTYTMRHRQVGLHRCSTIRSHHGRHCAKSL